jgi:hypothetical protein
VALGWGCPNEDDDNDDDDGSGTVSLREADLLSVACDDADCERDRVPVAVLVVLVEAPAAAAIAKSELLVADVEGPVEDEDEDEGPAASGANMSIIVCPCRCRSCWRLAGRVRDASTAVSESAFAVMPGESGLHAWSCMAEGAGAGVGVRRESQWLASAEGAAVVGTRAGRRRLVEGVLCMRRWAYADGSRAGVIQSGVVRSVERDRLGVDALAVPPVTASGTRG